MSLKGRTQGRNHLKKILKLSERCLKKHLKLSVVQSGKEFDFSSESGEEIIQMF